MPYKDVEKKRKAGREHAQRRRDHQKVLRDEARVDPRVVPGGVVPTIDTVHQVLPANFGEVDCMCKHCSANRKTGNKHIINHGTYKDCNQLADNEVNRVSLPGDIDYVGVAV